MLLENYLALAASAVFLGLAVISALRGQRRSLALATAALCVDMFCYTTLEVLGNLSDAPLWEWLEAAAASMAAPLLICTSRSRTSENASRGVSRWR